MKRVWSVKWFSSAIAIAVLGLAGCGPKSATNSNPNQPMIKAASPNPAFGFNRVFVVLMEDKNFSDAISDPNFGAFASQGALLTNYFAIGHPSLPNYLALTAGSTLGIGDDRFYTLNTSSLADLLEAKGLTWKSYAEDYPGNCFLKDSEPFEVHHEPFLYFQNVNSNASRCNSHVVPATQLQVDIQNNALPNYSFYVPNMNNNSHNTPVGFGGQWLANTILPLLSNPNFITGTLVVVVFDEDDTRHGEPPTLLGTRGNNQVYAALYGSMVKAGSQSNSLYEHYSLLRTIEDSFGLGTLGRNDASAVDIQGIWVSPSPTPTSTPTTTPTPTTIPPSPDGR